MVAQGSPLSLQPWLMPYPENWQQPQSFVKGAVPSLTSSLCVSP